MAPLVLPWQAGQEILACLGLGALVGAARSLAPGRGRGAILPDALLVGLVLLLLQSYAAGYSQAGSLRWYMAGAGAAGAGVAHALLAPVVRWILQLLLEPGRALARWALAPAARACGEHLRQKQQAYRQKRAAKKEKKILQKERRMLYNSNI